MAQLFRAAFLQALCVIIPRATTYSSGAPAEGCWSERPLHSDYLPQGGAALPYEITTNVTSYGPSETIIVTISSPVELEHKGFLLRVVTSSGRRGGRWAVDRSLQRYNPECGVTHRDPRSRSVTTVLWRSPNSALGSLGNIQFKAIVVANISVFWDNIVSHSISPVYPDASIATARRYQRILDMFEGVSGKINLDKQDTNGVEPLTVTPAALGSGLDNDITNVTSSTQPTVSPKSPA